MFRQWKEVNYLDIQNVLSSRTWNFNLVIKAQADKGTRAMCEIKKGKYHTLSVPCKPDLFDKVEKPVASYSSEGRGLRNYHMVEKVFWNVVNYCNLATSTSV